MFRCFDTVIETRVEIWENEPAGQLFPLYFEFSKTSTSVSVTYVCKLFYKITRRKLKRGSSLLH